MYKVIIILMFINIGKVLAEDKQELINKGKYDASKASDEVHASYLQCYALDPETKSLCQKKLSDKYISFKWKNNVYYVENFQYQAEKIGFLKFLQNHGLKCEAIDKGPIYQKEKEAYKVECNPNNQYFMSYDYKIGEWKLVK